MTATLDAHALLAYLGDEPGADDVLAILSDARAGREDVVLSVVNLGEVLYTVEIHRGWRRQSASSPSSTRPPSASWTPTAGSPSRRPD